MSSEDRGERKPGGVDRRGFLSRTSSLVMAGGLAAGYGAFAAIAARYLYPARPDPKGWLFVTDVGGMKVGDSLTLLRRDSRNRRSLDRWSGPRSAR